MSAEIYWNFLGHFNTNPATRPIFYQLQELRKARQTTNKQRSTPSSICLEDLEYVDVDFRLNKKRLQAIKVPRFLVYAFRFLHTRNYLQIEFIFRKEGNFMRLAEAESCFLSGNIPDDLSVFDVCALIKRFVKNIRGGIFGEKERRIVDFASDLDMKATKSLQGLCTIVNTLPHRNFGALAYLVFQLSKVIQHSNVNKMTVDNLAKVFTLSMFKSFYRQPCLVKDKIASIKQDQEVFDRTVVLLVQNVITLLQPPIVLREQHFSTFNSSLITQPIPLS